MYMYNCSRLTQTFQKVKQCQVCYLFQTEVSLGLNATLSDCFFFKAVTLTLAKEIPNTSSRPFFVVHEVCRKNFQLCPMQQTLNEL